MIALDVADGPHRDTSPQGQLLLTPPRRQPASPEHLTTGELVRHRYSCPMKSARYPASHGRCLEGPPHEPSRRLPANQRPLPPNVRDMERGEIGCEMNASLLVRAPGVLMDGLPVPAAG